MHGRIYSILYMCLITLVFTSMVSAIKMLTQERIELNQALKLEAIVLKVLQIRTLGDQSLSDLHNLFISRVKTIEIDGKPFYIGYEKDGNRIKGYAFPFSGQGFWGPIYGMVGVDSEGSRILGIAFYQHSETPGLGGRITEKWFTDQFKGLRLFPIVNDKKIFYLKPKGIASGPNELDAITGATRTSTAVETFLNTELDTFVKEFWKKLKGVTRNAQGAFRQTNISSRTVE